MLISRKIANWPFSHHVFCSTRQLNWDNPPMFFSKIYNVITRLLRMTTFSLFFSKASRPKKHMQPRTAPKQWHHPPTKQLPHGDIVKIKFVPIIIPKSEAPNALMGIYKPMGRGSYFQTTNSIPLPSHIPAQCWLHVPFDYGA